MSRQTVRQTKYREMASILEQEVRADYSLGDLLPTEAVLAERFGVNRHTVRQALDELVKAGMVIRMQGRGTQVVNNRIDYSVDAGSKVTQNLADLGLPAHTTLLDQRHEKPPSSIATLFSMDEGAPLLCVDTLRIVNQAPLMFVRHWFSPQRVPGWLRLYCGGSTRRLLAEHFDIRLSRRRVQIEAVIATRDDMHLLQCPSQAPMLVMTSENTDEQGNLVEVSIGRARADRISYHVDFEDMPKQEG